MPIGNDPNTAVVIKLALQHVFETSVGDMTRFKNWIADYFPSMDISVRLEVYTYMTRAMHKERRNRQSLLVQLPPDTEHDLELIFDYIQNNMGA